MTFSAQGQFACVSTLVETETKIKGLLLNIPAEVNYDLFLFKHDENGLTQLDASFQANAAVEKTFAKVQPGAYVLVAQATQGASADPVVFGWQGYTQIDSQEANDRFEQRTPLSTNAVIQGNLDNTNDFDYFSYAVGPDQAQLNLRFNASEQFVLETWSGSSWVQLPNNQLGAYSVTPNTTVNFLVRATADNPPPASAQYALAMAAPGTATSIDNLKVWNNERLSKLLLLAKPSPPATSTSVQAHSYVGVSGYLKDRNSTPAPFASLGFDIQSRNPDTLEYTTMASAQLTADEQGYFNGSLSLPDCANRPYEANNIHNRVYSGTPTNPSEWWDIDYNVARIYFYLIDVNDIPFRTNIESFYHICNEDLVKMCFNEKNYDTGGTKWTCLY